MYDLELTYDGHEWRATCPNIPWVVGRGRTPEEAGRAPIAAWRSLV
jgi:hypothetical protein